MKGYIDLFVLPVPKKNLRAYARISTAWGKIMRKHGALDYREFVGVDLKAKMLPSFQKKIPVKPGEVLVSAVIGFRSKAHRAQVNKRAMKDPSAKRIFDEITKKTLNDNKRTLYGGFATFVKA